MRIHREQRELPMYALVVAREDRRLGLCPSIRARVSTMRATSHSHPSRIALVGMCRFPSKETVPSSPEKLPGRPLYDDLSLLFVGFPMLFAVVPALQWLGFKVARANGLQPFCSRFH